MSKRSRLKFAMIAFFVFIGCAILKHFLPGLDVAILGIAAGPPLLYILGDTIRKSDTQ